jgi:acetyl-CoA acetyltransferase
MAGLQPKDIDVAQLYDCFTITVLMTLEDYGFCRKGEAGASSPTAPSRSAGACRSTRAEASCPRPACRVCSS